MHVTNNIRLLDLPPAEALSGYRQKKEFREKLVKLKLDKIQGTKALYVYMCS